MPINAQGQTVLSDAKGWLCWMLTTVYMVAWLVVGTALAFVIPDKYAYSVSLCGMTTFGFIPALFFRHEYHKCLREQGGKWFFLKHMPETGEWLPADCTEKEEPHPDISYYYYDGWLWAADVKACSFKEAVAKAKQMEKEYYAGC